MKKKVVAIIAFLLLILFFPIPVQKTKTEAFTVNETVNQTETHFEKEPFNETLNFAAPVEPLPYYQSPDYAVSVVIPRDYRSAMYQYSSLVHDKSQASSLVNQQFAAGFETCNKTVVLNLLALVQDAEIKGERAIWVGNNLVWDNPDLTADDYMLIDNTKTVIEKDLPFHFSQYNQTAAFYNNCTEEKTQNVSKYRMVEKNATVAVVTPVEKTKSVTVTEYETFAEAVYSRLIGN